MNDEEATAQMGHWLPFPARREPTSTMRSILATVVM